MKQNVSQSPKIQMKAYSFKEVAVMYEVSIKTLHTWLTPFKNEIGKKEGRYYTPKQIKVIFDKLGLPEFISLN